MPVNLSGAFSLRALEIRSVFEVEQILNTHFAIKWFHNRAKFQTIWNFEDNAIHIAKFLSTKLPLLLIIVIMTHTQEVLPDKHWLRALSTMNREPTIITDVRETQQSLAIKWLLFPIMKIFMFNLEQLILVSTFFLNWTWLSNIDKIH